MPRAPSSQSSRGLLGLSCARVCSAFRRATPAAAQQFEAESFTLGNGLQVVVLPNHRVPAVTQMVWYKVGAADDPRGKSGIAHFLEHLMFKGTETTRPASSRRLIAQNGGRDNAFTTADYTVFTRPSRAIGSNCSCGSKPTA